MYDTTNIYQLYSIINLLSLHIQTVISQKQSASTIPVRPSRVAAPWQLFTMWLARSVACFNEKMTSCCKLGIILVGSLKGTCPYMSYLVVSWIFCCWILCDGGAEMATVQCKYIFLTKLTPATFRTLIYQKLSTSWRRRSDVPNKSTTTLLFKPCKASNLFISIYKLSLFMPCLFTLSIPLSYFDYLGHVHPSLSFKGLAPHPWAVWPPPVWDSANAKQLPGESAWVATMVLLDTAKVQIISNRIVSSHALHTWKTTVSPKNWLHKSQRRLDGTQISRD